MGLIVSVTGISSDCLSVVSTFNLITYLPGGVCAPRYISSCTLALTFAPVTVASALVLGSINGGRFTALSVYVRSVLSLLITATTSAACLPMPMDRSLAVTWKPKGFG